MNRNENKKLLKLPQVAEMLGVTRRFLELEIARKRLSVVRLSPRVVRVRRIDLKRYVERNRTKAIGEELAQMANR